MVIAIASGKGGTGKTTIATNLAVALERAGVDVEFLDCDVEEPNAHIFLKPEIRVREKVNLAVPVVEKEKCTGCGRCGEVCQFSAILALGDTVLTFPALCHGCGGCVAFCPEGAISEGEREVGVLEKGTAGGIGFFHGRLRISEAMAPPLIRAVKNSAGCADVTIIDAPPGTSCPVIASVKGADFVILVTEPTPFGLNDLKLAVEMVKVIGIPFGVVVNRAGAGGSMTRDYCAEEDIEILAEIPDDRRVAEAYSRGEMVIDVFPEHEKAFNELFQKIKSKVESPNDTKRVATK